jgi:hypothetical protein
LCDKRETCEHNGHCHIACRRDRYVGTVPIVGGETGTGKHSIAALLPPALINHGAAIVYGHGLFTSGRHDFIDAFDKLLKIERTCFEYYFNQIGQIDSFWGPT